MSNLNLGLSVGDVVPVNVSLTPTAAAERNFGSLLILGDSGVIDVVSRYRQYASLSVVASDFPNTAPEYLAAALAFGQNPTLASLYIGAWARTATAGTLVGSVLSAAQQALSVFNAITNGSFSIIVNGVVQNFSSINLASATGLGSVASLLSTAIGSHGTITWNAAYGYFQYTSNATGATSTISFANTYLPGTYQDLSSPLGFQSTQGGYLAQGIAAETPLACVTTFANLSNSWYGVMFAASVMPADSDYVAVAGLINGLSTTRIFGVTTQEAAALVASSSSDVASQLQALNYSRTYVQYSSSSPYACAAAFGIAFTTNFNGSNTLYTLKFQIEAGLVAETLTETQAAALNGKNCNVFVNYNNGKAILQQGQMASGTFFDVIHGTDWLQNGIQTAVFNLLYTVGTKIPQTDAGVTQLINTITQELNQGVANDLIAPGVWDGPPVGAIVTGQTLSTGYYVYAPPISTQSQAARSARQAPVITACIKLAGAIHSAPVILNVNY